VSNRLTYTRGSDNGNGVKYTVTAVIVSALVSAIVGLGLGLWVTREVDATVRTELQNSTQSAISYNCETQANGRIAGNEFRESVSLFATAMDDILAYLVKYGSGDDPRFEALVETAHEVISRDVIPGARQLALVDCDRVRLK
jgi:hypothetical protein